METPACQSGTSFSILIGALRTILINDNVIKDNQ